MQVYLENPEYNFDRVNRASQACGPLVKWAIAQVSAFIFKYMDFKYPVLEFTINCKNSVLYARCYILGELLGCTKPRGTPT